jgi:hypothetical protein
VLSHRPPPAPDTLKTRACGQQPVARHYIKFVIAIAISGLAGTLFGGHVTGLYADCLAFPFLVFTRSPDLCVAAVVLSLAAAVLGAGRALREVAKLPPAIAMQRNHPVRTDLIADYRGKCHPDVRTGHAGPPLLCIPGEIDAY